MSKSAKRRNKANATTTQQPEDSPTKPALKSRRETSRPKPPPLPQEDYKLVMRPKNGLGLGSVSPALLAESILNAAQLSWREAEIRVRIDGKQNILTVSTPHQQAAKALSQITQLNVQGRIHPVNLYGLAPYDSCKGVIHGIPSHYTMEQVLDDIWCPGYEFLSCRRLGKSGTVVITLQGHKVPFYIYYKGVELKCFIYKKTIPYCTNCHRTGHRADVCVAVGIRACERCGVRDPALNHPCHPKCDLCNGEHITGCRECPKRFREPYILRRKAWEKSKQHFGSRRGASKDRSEHSVSWDESRLRSSSRSNSRSQWPSLERCTGEAERRSRSRSKHRPEGSRHETRGRSRSRSCSKSVPLAKQHGKGEKHNQVSWASVISPAARTPPPPHQCIECNKLQAEIQTLRTEIQTLKKFLAEQTKNVNTLTQSNPAIRELTSEEKTPPPPSNLQPDQQPINEKKRKIDNQEEDTMETNPQYVTIETLNVSLGDATNPILNQLQAIASQLNQLSVQVQNTQHRVESLENQTTPVPGRLARREKPYHRPVLNDTGTDLPINQNDH